MHSETFASWLRTECAPIVGDSSPAAGAHAFLALFRRRHHPAVPPYFWPPPAIVDRRSNATPPAAVRDRLASLKLICKRCHSPSIRWSQSTLRSREASISSLQLKEPMHESHAPQLFQRFIRGLGPRHWRAGSRVPGPPGLPIRGCTAGHLLRSPEGRKPWQVPPSARPACLPVSTDQLTTLKQAILVD